jgi:hypothetical protein
VGSVAAIEGEKDLGNLIIDVFKGISPRFLDSAPAVTAENVDISGQKIMPIRGTLMQSAVFGSPDSIVKFGGAWYWGLGRYYLRWPIGESDLLIYLDDAGAPYKRVGSSVATLGQTRPAAPTLADAAVSGNVTGKVQYLITWTRNVGGHVDESGVSALSVELTVAASQVTVTRPSGYDAFVTHWNIYRISSNTGEFQFVATVAIATATYTDNVADIDLSASPTTWYTSNQGNEILWDEPQVSFDGLASDIHGGMLFAWRGNTLYWSEPGYPDAWPSFFSMNFPATIKAVIPFAGFVSVLTAIGPFRVDGTNPELLQQTEALGREPATGPAVRTSAGVVYLSDSGLVNFDGNRPNIFTDAKFTEAWFRENVTGTPVLAENDRMLYLFHGGGTLVYNAVIDQFTTMDLAAYGAWKDDEAGELYVSTDRGIELLYGDAASYLTWTWKSGDMAQAFRDVDVVGVEVQGKGSVTLKIWVDDTLRGPKVLSLSSSAYRKRTLRLPQEAQGQVIQIEMQGALGAEVEKVDVTA